MGNSLRCCLACVLPCGAFDLIRIVHLNGTVEEYSRQVSASEILAANPSHILCRPCSEGVVRRMIIVSPDSDLKRGSIYFLIPERKRRKSNKKVKQRQRASGSDQDSYLAEILADKKSGDRRRRSGRVGVWRPHLEIIREDA